jgi:putative flavoprotein involved in K+ transport
VTGAEGTTLRFADGSEQTVSTVIWATGFRVDHSLVQLPVFGTDGRVAHRRGVTAVPGLYFLGLPWLYTRGSALLGWVEDDAEYIARQIGSRQAERRRHGEDLSVANSSSVTEDGGEAAGRAR